MVRKSSIDALSVSESLNGKSASTTTTNGNGSQMQNIKFVIDARLYAWYNEVLKFFMGSNDMSTTGLKDLKAFRLFKRVSFSCCDYFVCFLLQNTYQN